MEDARTSKLIEIAFSCYFSLCGEKTEQSPQICDK